MPDFENKERMMEDFARLGIRYLMVLRKKERQMLYKYMDVKTANEALCKRQYHRYFNA